MNFVVTEKFWNLLFTINQVFFHHVLANVIKTIRIVCSRWNLAYRLFWICPIWWWFWLFVFWIENSLLDKFGSKRQNCLFEMKVRTYNTSQKIWEFFMFYHSVHWHLVNGAILLSHKIECARSLTSSQRNYNLGS